MGTECETDEILQPRGSTYTTIRELGPIISSIVWHFGSQFPNSFTYVDPLGKLSQASLSSLDLAVAELPPWAHLAAD